MNKLKDNYLCSLQLFSVIVGGKWKLRILWYLMEKTHRYSDIKKRMPDITQKVLTEQLRELENYGLVSRVIYPEVPPRVEYSITDKARELSPMFASIVGWTKEYAENNKIELETNKKI